ncbi:type IV toxin-antitoxin system AbiEi family antitoxin domain-containing protein [Candidatus Poriferisocius sp.]|uniref:type IV toxin-antitoxin system AbiEi family antitoxin domain-containing protein n=1 Tax=Candidatus Poriferisocius sp. TaxID=3101276 RepID=UPI003B5CFA3A
MTQDSSAPVVRFAAHADLMVTEGGAIGRELERMQARLGEVLDPLLAEATKGMQDRLATMIASRLEEVAQSEGFREAISEAAREITLRASVVEAMDRSGYRSALYALAANHHGFLTTEMARSVGVPAVEVRKLAARGGMSNVARGLYRVEGIDGGDHAPFAEAVLRVGQEAHLVGESVLALHDLAFVNPRRIKVGTPRRVRRELPAHIELVHTRTDPADLTEYYGIGSLTVAAAIRDSIGAVMPERLTESVERATEEGLVRRRDASALLAEIAAAE